MKCEFDYCIYNKNFKCIVDEPDINSLGMCDVCIVISLDRKFLDKEKEKQLLEIESRWAKNTETTKNKTVPVRGCLRSSA